MNKSKKIIFSANASWYLWNFRRNLMHEFLRNSNSIIATSSRDEYTEKLSREIPFIEINHMQRSGMNPFRDLLLFLEYINLYRKERPHLVFNFTIKSNIYSSLACRLLGIPAISTVTGLGFSFLKQGWLQKMTIMLYKVALAKNCWVVFQNADDLELFVSKKIISKDKAVLIEGSGVDTNHFKKEQNVREVKNNVVFLLCARMLRDKGIIEFVEAARMVRSVRSSTRFQLLGPIDSGNLACISKEELDAWKREGVVEYFGKSDDVAPYVAEADVVVLPSYREGLPKSLLEAMAMEKPIITTDIPGCRSVVTDGVNGFLVPVKDSKRLADAMIKMIDKGQEGRSKMGQAGRAMVMMKFDEKIILQEYKNIARKILGL